MDALLRQVVELVRSRAALAPGERLPIARAAAVLATTPRMLRYREQLGLVAPLRGTGGHREYGERELVGAALAAELERRYDVGPGEVAFALRLLREPMVAADVRALGQLIHRLASPTADALDFEAAKARRLLRIPR